MAVLSPDASFQDRLRHVQQAHQSVVCVGLDPDPARLPAYLLEGRSIHEAVAIFCREIMEATADVACAFKLNLAFFEVLGPEGWHVLSEVIAAAPSGPLLIADAKRGDIGNSARFYAEALFDRLGCDACTVAPYMGRDSIMPFLQFPGRAAFVLARTSNPGAADFQEVNAGGEPLFLRVARRVDDWAHEAIGEAGLVVGATEPSAIEAVRTACPSLPFLIPGVGAQGGDARQTMQAAVTGEGLAIVNSSRQIIYASPGPDFAAAAAREANALRLQLLTAVS